MNAVINYQSLVITQRIFYLDSWEKNNNLNCVLSQVQYIFLFWKYSLIFILQVSEGCAPENISSVSQKKLAKFCSSSQVHTWHLYALTLIPT